MTIEATIKCDGLYCSNYHHIPADEIDCLENALPNGWLEDPAEDAHYCPTCAEIILERGELEA